MKRSNKNTKVLTLAVLVLSSSFAHAAKIKWSRPVDIKDQTDVSKTGELVFAYNLGGSKSTNSVNGVTFIGLDASNHKQISYTNLGSASQTAYRNDSKGSAFSKIKSAQYKNILGSGVHQGGGEATVNVLLLNLKPGSTYQIQFWVNDARNRRDTEIRELDIKGSSYDVEYNTDGNDSDKGLGQYIIGTFTADAASQDFTFDSGAPQLNAIQLRSVPKP